MLFCKISDKEEYDSNPDRSVGSDTRRKFHKSDSENDIDFYEEQERPKVVTFFTTYSLTSFFLANFAFTL